MQALEKFLDKFLGPVAAFMNKSKLFQALSEAFMRLTPITLGAAILMIIGNLPIPQWITFMEETGLKSHFAAIVGATTNMLTLYVTFNFGYIYTRNAKANPLTGGLLALAAYFIITPQTITVPGLDGVTVPGLAVSVTDGTGIITGLFAAWLCSVLYIRLNKANFTIKLPASVPTNVSESLSPSLLSGVIFIVFFAIRLLFAYAPFLNFWEGAVIGSGYLIHFISRFIQGPLQALGGSPLAIIFIFTLANICWFFGIHPNMIYGAIMPFIISNNAQNIQASIQGEPLPFLIAMPILAVCGNAYGGQGGTIGLVVSMFTAKSQRYKEMRKLAVAPALFNINEPLVFGMPIMMNTTYFIPLVLSPAIMGFTAWGVLKLVNFTTYRPEIQLPWTTPAVITTFVQGGWKYGVMSIAVILVSILIWFPFFKLADKKECEIEKSIAE